SAILNPRGIAVDLAGTIYFANETLVLKLTPSNSPPVASIAANGVLNAASFASGPVSPGGIASVFGSFLLNLGSWTRADATPLPTVLSGLSIQFPSAGGISAPLFYASSD